MRDVLLDLAVGIVVLCTMMMTVLTISRALPGPDPVAGLRPRREAPVYLENWRELAVGHRIGPVAADVTVVTFSDFECPSCRSLANTYRDFAARHPGRTALVFRHWPLSKHRFAYPAARAAECAAAQGRFTAFHDLVFDQQDQLGLRTFQQFAEDAGVQDLVAFEACYRDQQPVPTIERDIQVARNLGGIGTPTVIVNGWLLRGGVPPQLLDSLARQFVTTSVSEAAEIEHKQAPRTGVAR
jgi:predicted DsbA family dithiol-disulfide isomerase